MSSVSPRIGASDSAGSSGVPGKEVFRGDIAPATIFGSAPTLFNALASCPSGWLYRYVAVRTVDEPMRKPGVTWKLKSAMEAKKVRMMLGEVAKALRIFDDERSD